MRVDLLNFFYRRERELRKLYETSQEKRQRRLAKKMEKERKQKAALGWDALQMVSECSLVEMCIVNFT